MIRTIIQANVLFGSLGSRASGPVGVCRWLGTTERGNNGVVHSLIASGRNPSLHCDLVSKQIQKQK